MTPYDPEKHGDAAYELQSFDVVPESGSEIQIWQEFVNSKELRRSFRAWLDEKTCWGDILGGVGEAVGWTLLPAPTKPEPPKSYAEYLDNDGDMELPDGNWIDAEVIEEHPRAYLEAVKFILDNMPFGTCKQLALKEIQDTLSEGEGG